MEVPPTRPEGFWVPAEALRTVLGCLYGWLRVFRPTLRGAAFLAASSRGSPSSDDLHTDTRMHSVFSRRFLVLPPAPRRFLPPPTVCGPTLRDCPPPPLAAELQISIQAFLLSNPLSEAGTP